MQRMIMDERPDNSDARFYRDNGTEINPELVSKPSLCVTCRKDSDPNEEILCTLTRADQEGEVKFICHGYEPVKKY